MSEILPTLLDYVCNNGSSIIKVLQQHEVDITLVLTEAFLCLLSAVLERQAPHHYAATGSSLSSSRAESVRSGRESIASIYSAKSSDSFHTEKTPVLSPVDTLSEFVLEDGGLNEATSECSRSDIDAQLLLSQQYQATTMVIFAAIWSFGAYIPFR